MLCIHAERPVCAALALRKDCIRSLGKVIDGIHPVPAVVRYLHDVHLEIVCRHLPDQGFHANLVQVAQNQLGNAAHGQLENRACVVRIGDPADAVAADIVLMRVKHLDVEICQLQIHAGVQLEHPAFRPG